MDCAIRRGGADPTGVVDLADWEVDRTMTAGEAPAATRHTAPAVTAAAVVAARARVRIVTLIRSDYGCCCCVVAARFRSAMIRS
jgi:hypothetical protein